jgi:hypothetical protein
VNQPPVGQGTRSSAAGLGRLRRRRRRLLIALAGYGVFLALVAAGYADRLILFPTTNHIDTSALLGRRTARLPSGSSVEIWIARSPGAARAEPRAYVLAFIGNAARAELTAPFFAKDWGDRPVEVWAVNYPGYGTSPGAARLASIAPASLAAYDELRRHAGDKPVFLEARSIGTAAALYVAAHRPVAGCILHNPPPLRQLILGRYGWWNLWLVGGPIALSVPRELDSIANAASVDAPAVFVLGGADQVVPESYQRRVADAYRGEHRMVLSAGSSHTDRISGRALDEYKMALDWIFKR